MCTEPRKTSIMPLWKVPIGDSRAWKNNNENEPVCAINKKNDCLRSGVENCAMKSLNKCTTTGKQCKKCYLMGQFGNVCRNNPKKQTPLTSALRRVNWVEANEEIEEQYLVSFYGFETPHSL